MSCYEDYTRTSASYDETRRPVGLEIILGSLSRGPVPVDRMTILDAGCGTGSYAAAMLGHVRRVEAVDINEQMVAAARRKLAAVGRLALARFAVTRCSIEELPFDNRTFDGVMVNQVLHHLADGPEFKTHHRAIREFARVLKPDGTLVVNTSSQTQLRRGFWFYNLIPGAASNLARRFAPLDRLTEILEVAGFQNATRIIPLDELLQERSYFDPRGPLDKAWRDGDSAWSLCTEKQLRRVHDVIRQLNRERQLEAQFDRWDAGRRETGQVTFLCATRGTEENIAAFTGSRRDEAVAPLGVSRPRHVPAAGLLPCRI